MEFALWSIISALLTRILFTAHSFLAVWRLTDQKDDIRYWACLVPLLLMLFETIYVISQRKGREYKWFSVCILLYLFCVVPTVWFLELDRVDKYRERLVGAGANAANATNATNATCLQKTNVKEIAETLSEIQGLRIPLKLTSDAWLAVIEQTLIFLLVIGRWWLPTQELSRDQLSQLLFMYLSMGSDMTELLVLFEEDYVLKDEVIVYVILGVWSACLVQFTICFTATQENKHEKRKKHCCPCCRREMIIIFSSVFLQDAPFLAVRLYVIIKNKTLSYTILFFTLKNTLVVLLQAYRFMILICCPDDRKEQQQQQQQYIYQYQQYAPNPAPIEQSKVKKRKNKAKSNEGNVPQMQSPMNGTPIGPPNHGFPAQPMVMNTGMMNTASMNTGMNMNHQFTPYQNYGYQY